MSTERFTTNCPSCDAGVAVKAALVGKKIECPKCKFRFVVPAPAGEEPAAPAKGGKSVKPAAKAAPADDPKGDPKGGKEKPAKGKGGKGKKETKAKGGNGQVIIGAIVGVVALIGLAFGAVLIASKLNSNKEAEAFNKQQQTQNNSNNGGGGRGGDQTSPITPGGTTDPITPGGMTDPVTPGGPPVTPGGPPVTPGGTTDPITPGGTNPGTTPIQPKPKKPRPTGVNITNLLPGDTAAIFHARMDDLDRDARPLRNVVFDKVTTDLFERAMNFHPDQIFELVQGEVGTAREPFVVFRTKVSLDEGLFTQPKMDTTTAETIQGRQYRVINRNAFVSAAEKSLGIATILSSALGFDLPATDAGKGKEVKYAVCLYDANTLILAEHVLMQRFLSELKETGYPEFQTQFKEEAPPPPKPADGTTGGPGVPPGLGGEGSRGEGSRGEGSRGEGSRGEGPRGGPVVSGGVSGPGGAAPLQPGGASGLGNPDTPPPSGPPKPKKSLTGNPNFLSVKQDLKKALNTLEDEEKDLPVAAYVTRVDTAQVNLLDLRNLKLEQIAAAQILKDFKVLGLAVTRVTEKRGSFSGYLEYTSDDAAKNSVEQQLMTALPALLASRLPAKLLPVDVRNADDANGNTNPNTPGGYPGGYPGGSPGYPGPSSGSGPGSFTPGGGSPSPPPPTSGGGRGGKGGEASNPRDQGGLRPDDENAQGPPPRGVGTLEGPPGIPPGGTTTGPGYPGPGYPGGEGSGPGTPPPPGGNSILISRDGRFVTLSGEFNWEKDFATAVEPALARQGAVVRGKMGMYSGEAGVFALAAKPVDGKPAGGVIAKAYRDDKDAALPQGALPRDARSDDRKLPGTTTGLPYQPEQRCSFFAELTKYMDNKGGLHRRMDTNQAWYEKPNLDLAETWIPELLVPDYPQSSWRATNELIKDGRSVGATNYVGVAGLGLDAARLNPKNPDDAKKAGLTGYDFGSKVDDVKDGLSNTAYLIQVPPTYQRPWMAGGGATLQGVNEKGNDPARPFMVKKADGTRGTMVLMGDGSVRYVKEGIDPAAFRAMATRAGGETLADLDKVAPPARPNVTGELKAGK